MSSQFGEQMFNRNLTNNFKINTLNKALMTGALASTMALAGCQNTKPVTHPVDLKVTSHPVANQHNDDHGHKQARWGYGAEDRLSPEDWGDLEVNKLCSAGIEQSPINIVKATQPAATSDHALTLIDQYNADDFEVVNNGHTIVFTAKNPKANVLKVNGEPYELLQFHYHVPSEHTVMSTQYPLEIHFVHKSLDNQLAVVGVLVNAGKSNTHLQRVISDLPKKGKSGLTLLQFNVKDLMPKDSKTLAYDGSLTTPPCSERVQWLLKQTPIAASSSQLNRLAEMYEGNNRPLQQQGERTVYYVD
ncbi:MAG: carbonic anhydrase family protein [Psychrobacter sp.]|nr:carbonic anhydrase family protein [Psychrobacter sp.]